ASRLAPAMDEQGADITNVNDGSWAWGAGTLVATPPDIAKWIEAVASTQVFDNASEAKLLAPSPTDGATYSAGLGIFVFQTDIGPLIGHSGLINGYQTNALHSREHHVSVVAFVDRAPPPSSNDSIDLSNAVFGALFHK